MSWNYKGRAVTFREFREYRQAFIAWHGWTAAQFDALPIRYKLIESEYDFGITAGEWIARLPDSAPFCIVDSCGVVHAVKDVVVKRGSLLLHLYPEYSH